jgi:excisionase family DNA binding protein
MDQFLTVEQIAGLLKVEGVTVRRWVSAGRLRAFRPAGGRLWRVHAIDFQRFVKGGSKGQANEKRTQP